MKEGLSVIDMMNVGLDPSILQYATLQYFGTGLLSELC